MGPSDRTGAPPPERSALERRVAELEQFTHGVAHTLKTDWITAGLLIDEILGLLEDAESAGEEPPLGELGELLAELRGRAEKGARTVHDLLAYAVGGARPELVEGSLRDVAREVAGRVGATTVSVADDFPDVRVRFDPRTFPVALFQLVENGVKYGEGKPVEISFAGGRMAIRDHGRGIAPEQLGEIFLPFKRAANDIAGTGLGLAIARQIVEAHGYRVWAESEGPGRGSVFIVDVGDPARA